MSIEAPEVIRGAPGRLGAHGAPGSARRHRGWWYFGAFLLVIVGGGALAMYLLRPSVSISAGGPELATVSLRGPGTTLVAAGAHLGSKTVGLVDHGGVLQPSSPLPAGTAVSVTVTARSPWWASWWAGSRITKTVSVDAPTATFSASVDEFPPGGSPSVHFAQPVRLVTWTYAGTTHTQQLTTPATTVALALPSGHPAYGTVQISAARYQWETLSAPAALTFFQGTGPLVAATPAPGADPSPSTPITLAFSRPVTSLFGRSLPTVSVALLSTPPAGKWSSPDPYTLRFQPAAGALWPGQNVQVHLPASVRVNGGAPTTTLSYSLAQGSVARLQQELAALNYLPFNWTPAAGQPAAPSNVDSAAAVANSAPQGSFSWRWAPPSLLAAMWQPGQDGILTQGAVKAFEHVSGLDPVGYANPLLWPYLAQALAANKQNPNGYTWVDVSKTLPETLTVWHNGQAVITTPTNTGIPQDPTADGTYAVYLRYTAQVMRGTNPDGSTYADPVKWVSYFNGSDAIHGFVRATYGSPQSLGCAELPYATAQQVYPLTPIGTLVTVH